MDILANILTIKAISSAIWVLIVTLLTHYIYSSSKTSIKDKNKKYIIIYSVVTSISGVLAFTTFEDKFRSTDFILMLILLVVFIFFMRDVEGTSTINKIVISLVVLGLCVIVGGHTLNVPLQDSVLGKKVVLNEDNQDVEVVPSEETEQSKQEALAVAENYVMQDSFKAMCGDEVGVHLPACYDSWAEYFKTAYTNPTDGAFLQYLSAERDFTKTAKTDVEETKLKLQFLNQLSNQLVTAAEKPAKAKVADDVRRLSLSVKTLEEQLPELETNLTKLEQVALFNHEYMMIQGWVSDTYKVVYYSTDAETAATAPLDMVTYVPSYTGSLSLSKDTLAWVSKKVKTLKGE